MSSDLQSIESSSDDYENQVRRIEYQITTLDETRIELSANVLSKEDKNTLATELNSVVATLLLLAKLIGIDQTGHYDTETCNSEQITKFNELNEAIKDLKTTILHMLH